MLWRVFFFVLFSKCQCQFECEFEFKLIFILFYFILSKIVVYVKLFVYTNLVCK